MKIIRIVFGLFVFAVGAVFTLNANVGVAPWDVLHQGIANVTSLTIGKANIMTGICIIMLDIFLGQAIGIATILNMILIGTFIDILMLNNIIPIYDALFIRYIMLLIGIVIQGFGVYFYISAGLGAGPRDGLMVILTKRLNKPVKVIKTTIEVVAVSVGFVLGGNLGIGTLIMAFFAGQIWQIIFDALNFDIKQVEHRFLQEELKLLKQRI